MTPGYFLGGLDHAVAQPVAPAQVSDPTTQVIDADMIASGRVTKAANLTDAHGVGKGLISGHVYLTSPNGNPGATYDNGNIKLDGITVYAQFRDKDGSYSPIFSAKTHTLPDVVAGNGGQGTFAFGTGDKGITWTDKLGTEHTWAARTDQKHRIWVEPYTNERGNQVVMLRQANGFVPGSFNGVVEGPLGSFVAADGNIQLMAAFYQEVPPNHETSWMAAKGDKLVEDSEGPIARAATQTGVPNTISGRVWLETGGPDKGIVATGPSKNGIDEAADGYTVYASTLTKDGAAANQKLHEQYKDDPSKLADATKKMLEDHPEYILKTVHGKTDNEGYYALRFGKYEKGQVREDILNPNHVFVWVENKDGVVQNGYTGFHTPVFQRFNDGGNFRASAAPGENQVPINFNGVPFQNLNSLYNVNYAIMPYTPVTITADYNATDKPAAPGTTVTPEFFGDLSSLPSKVEWRDSKGNVLKTCELDQSKGIKAQVAACTFDIPETAKKGDYFNVVLVSGGNDVSAWTVLVTKESDEYEPAYADGQGAPGTKAPVDAPTFTDNEGKTVDMPAGTKFSTDKEGVEVAEDGSLTVQIPAEASPGDEITVPVTVTYPDGSTDQVEAKVQVVEDGDGDGVNPDPDGDNDGEADDPNAPGAESQKVTFGVKIDGEIVKSDGNNDTADELPESVRDVVVTLTAEDGTEYKSNDNGETWRGTKSYPVVQNFGLKDIPKGTYKVSISGLDDINKDDLKVKEGSQLSDGGQVEITGNTPNLFVELESADYKKYEPAYEGKLVVPGEETKSSPTFTDKDGKDVTAPEGSTFAIGEGFTAPEGYEVSIDENTGEITVTFPDGSKLNKDTVEEFDVPVVVTYPDTTVDKTDAKFKLDTDGDGTSDIEDEDDDDDGIPDEKEKEDDTNPKSPNQNTIFEPGYEDGSGKPGEDVTVPAPEFKDKDGNPTEAPEGTTFGPGENAPDGVTIDETTGEITVTIPEDAKPGDKIEVPVVVTYPDGTTDEVTVTVTVEQPGAKDNEKFEPEYEGKLVVPGEETKSSPTFTDKDGKGIDVPEGSKFSIGDYKAPEGYVVTIDESSGEITVTFPDGSKLNKDTVEEFDVPVTV
ncbi:YPDG domain-containing protein, partial [Gleimia europaea]|nr:YPDG domain-containing protein [Gleimia europaea]